MRKKIAAANWKMNLTLAEGESLIQNILDAGLPLAEDREVLICPPFPYLIRAKNMVKDYAHYYVGAQNCASEASGAYTGEVSAKMLQSVNTDYVILGHSERREYYGETNELIRKKVVQALAHGLRPLFCCGETLDIREKDGQNDYVQKQLEESLFTLSEEEIKKVVIAYEPVWAIGTGRTATPQQAQEMHAFIRAGIAEKYGDATAERQTILYGGSCKPDNAAELFACPDVDGALVGGASLKAESFTAIAQCL
jgi:triosephosphate isomerase